MTSRETGGLQRLGKAAGYSMQGLIAAYRHEAAFRQECWCALILIPTALWLGENGVECALLMGAVLLVLIVELLNSGIEAVVDRFGDEHHELSGRAKDTGSAAVFIALMNTCFVWALVLSG